MSEDARDSDLAHGRLEQTCPDCGRWEAAHHYCTWCLRPTTGDEWYRNNDVEQRRARLPASAPENPPPEYRGSASGWPKTWGAFPGKRRETSDETSDDGRRSGVSERGSRVLADDRDDDGSTPVVPAPVARRDERDESSGVARRSDDGDDERAAPATSTTTTRRDASSGRAGGQR